MIINDNIQKLFDPILLILEQYESGISEYDLLKNLAHRDDAKIHIEPFKDNLTLFQTHFMLFHILYKLKEYLELFKNQTLEISCLCIKISPFFLNPSLNQNITFYDPMKSYYLDINNLINTTNDTVNEMLNSFWKKFSNYNKRTEALDILGLSDPIEREEIEKRFRQLILEHHPDKGGNKEYIIQINRAMEILRS